MNDELRKELKTYTEDIMAFLVDRVYSNSPKPELIKFIKNREKEFFALIEQSNRQARISEIEYITSMLFETDDDGFADFITKRLAELKQPKGE